MSKISAVNTNLKYPKMGKKYRKQQVCDINTATANNIHVNLMFV